ncbi:putative disease resistance RPP13-like protein 1 [Vitis vinifera]|uniref:Putative disease resistance RPP13-like protein 1 n=1 Tax=Vitis vinifera TaxID=29760 RepID=A0A438J6W6_VITVI|nr:putative disease resistance RPP13-like protein 1 [Vitis vinifera]
MAGATVGGAFLSASLQVLFDRLASREVLSFIRGQKLISDALLKKLERKLVIVHAVLNDAEVKQFINSSVKKWLYLLKEAVYDAEDIFDEVATEAQRCKMEAAGYQTSTSQVGYILFTWFHAPFDNQSIEPRVEEIIDRLEDIAHDRDALGDGEKQKIIELLLSDDARSDEIGVISIVGMCGAGKTTLAQLLYNDQTVKEHFDLKAWVWVSEEFDPIKVTKTILEAIQEFDPNSQEAITNDLNLLQLQLKESINMKKFLLILDDVWNEDSNNWDKLRTPLIVGSKGSKIVVTTRSTNVAIAMRAFHTHCLGGLSFEDSWLLFKKLVFETEDSSIHPQLEAIGKIIVVKCQGLPLAIKALGSFLRSKTEAREWDDILKSKMCQWSSNELLPALTLSYYHLPSQLKRCFAYCSIFPKDYEFNKEKLILLWMAEGLLQEDFSKQMEEVGDIKNGSRIGELRKLSDIQGRLKISKLHNVESGGDAMEANLKDKSLDKKTDDVTQKGAPWDKKTEDVIQKGDILDNFQPHRNLKRLYISSFGGSRFSDWIGNPSFFSLVSLELFHCEHCSSLPPLGRLPSLKHLHVQGMTGIEKVGSEFYGNTSSSVTVNPFFPSLCTLRFKFMWNWEKWLCCGGRRGEFPRLQELYIINCPKLIGKLSKQLRSLKKLEITNCPQLLGASIRVPAIHELMMVNCGKLQLKRPACGFTCLEILEISDISQWKQLPSGLKKLSIKECDSTETLLEGTLQSNTCLLQHLVIRNSSFSRSLLMVGLPSTLKSLKIYNSTKLEFLLPELLRCHHPFLEYIWIEGSTCDSPSLSLSLSIFPRLTNLRMEDLEGLEYLSILISKGDPTSLSCLTVTACPGLVSIELPALNLASYWISHCSELKFLKHNLSSLQRLSLEACPELLFERESLPLDLRELEISNCNKLTPRVDWGLPRVASLTHFTIRNGCEDMELFPGECLLPSTLTSLEIEHLPNLKSLESKGLQQLTSLTKLSILNCPKFQSFGEVGLQHLTSLRHIQISYCPVLKSLTDVGLQHLISLEELWVIDCPKLQYLAKERLSNSLSCLTIKECPLLEHRCQFGKGQYWHYIAHIPHIIINDGLTDMSPVIRHGMKQFSRHTRFYEVDMFKGTDGRWSEEDVAVLVPG